MTKDEALKLALKAFKEINYDQAYANEIAAIREALAQPEQEPEPEPVAYEIRAFNTTQALFKRADVAQEKADVLERGFGSEAEVTIVPLYTTPQPAVPQRTWVGLTDADLRQIILAAVGVAEAKLKEKNT